MYILICCLIPTLSVSYLGNNLKWIYFNITLLIALFFYCKKKKVSFYIKPIKPFLFLFLFYLCVIPFQYSTPYSFQLSSWIGQTFRYFILPLTISTLFYCRIKNKHRFNVKYFDYTIYAAIAIACVYGLILTQIRGINPYLFMMLQNTDYTERLLTDYTQSDGRLFGRIFSVFPHPMTFGVFLVSSYSFCLHKLLGKINTKLVLILLLLVVVNAVTCGVRSVIGAILIATIAFLLLNKKFNYLWWFFLGGIIGCIIISTNDILWNYVLSIFDSSSKTGISGSSIDLRLRQLSGCIDEISNNLFFGKGYNWTAFYESVKGLHPVILAFESLIFVIICNWGVLGIIAWSIFLYKLHLQNKHQYLKGFDRFHILDVYSISYISYVCITGDYAYTIYWMLFYVYIYMDQMYIYINNKRKIR